MMSGIIDRLMQHAPEPEDKPGPTRCAYCETETEYRWMPMMGGTWQYYHNGEKSDKATACNPCRKDRAKANRLQARRDQNSKVYQAWLRDIPRAIQDPKLQDFPETLAQSLWDWCNDDVWSITLTGPSGTGKTHAAFALARSWYHAHLNSNAGSPAPLFSPLSELVAAARSAAMSGGHEGALDHFKKHAGLVILDEMTGERVTEFALEAVYAVIYHRDMNQLPTIITTNLTLDEISEKFSDRIASRIGGGLVVKMNGSDYRLRP